MRTLHSPGPVIVGTGLAGLACATWMSPTPCVVLTAGEVGEGTSTSLAQGGLAAAVGPDDAPALHAEDTHAAGAGLCLPESVSGVTSAGPGVVARLLALGTSFDREPDGSLARALEGAHGRRRVLHHADSSGAELLRAAAEAARHTPSVSILRHTRVLRVLVEDSAAVGVLADQDGERIIIAAPAVVLATGGLGGLYVHTTNPLSSQGQGLALAVRAGASLRDVEMTQFHPTALDIGEDPMPLISEAVRGEGAILVNERGERFVEPLAARDVVSRSEWQQMLDGHQVLLDARCVQGFVHHFPGIAETCHQAGLDPTTDLLPVRPAAHYHMGGILAGLDGRTDLPGLYALGECSSTGLHGANRLASNSLLEAAVCASGAATTLRGICSHTVAHVAAARRAAARLGHIETAPAPIPVRELVERHAGVLRDAEGLRGLQQATAPWLAHDDALVAHLLATAALERRESRGSHQRSDHPGTAAAPEHTLMGMPLTAPAPMAVAR